MVENTSQNTFKKIPRGRQEEKKNKEMIKSENHFIKSRSAVKSKINSE